MSNYRTIGEVEEEYLRNHPEELDDYITVLFDEYAQSGDTSLNSKSLTSKPNYSTSSTTRLPPKESSLETTAKPNKPLGI
jgi:hypothetical protein